MLLPCRYVWLPLWVLDGNQHEDSQDAITSSPRSTMTGLQVIVQWQALWRMSDLDTLPKRLMPMHSSPVNVSHNVDDTN